MGMSKPTTAIVRPAHVLLGALATVLLLAYMFGSGSSGSSTAGSLTREDETLAAKGHHVTLELFIMSMCPDAQACEKAFNPILEKMHPFVKVKTEYIGSAKEADKSVNCMHGAQECEGNIHQLCLQHHIPRTKNYSWFYQYLLCVWKDVSSIGKLASSRECMSQVGMGPEHQAPVLRCIEGNEGRERLYHSAVAAKARGALKSCTVHIEGAKRCVRDGGRWYDCPGGSSPEEFTASLCEAYQKRTGERPAICPPPQAAAAPGADAAAKPAEAAGGR